LYDSLRIGARAVLQFYPDGKNQLEMITTAAMKSGFTGGLVVDFPNSTRAKKYYLVIEAGVRRNLAIV
jgi:18S rRNA (guanine1575-N7)-methyltransferase